ncbi:MAG: hypothetical protein L3K19_02835 [Thermoplasmata archaeon]|nr:hypothetical protein [Thermoplasmata archaeon]
MGSIKVVATHDVVQALHPRPASPDDELGKAVGTAIDSALSRYSHQFSRQLRPTHPAILAYAVEILDDRLLETDVELTAADRETVLAQIDGVIRAFRKSPVFGLPRPRSRLILIGEEVGVYAQPDYWDGSLRFFEMKSYHAMPMPPDVALQVRCFQLAFPQCEGYLACFDRHSTPVRVSIDRVPPPTEDEVRSTLESARTIAREVGVEKVLEYIDAPVIRYALGSPRPPA